MSRNDSINLLDDSHHFSKRGLIRLNPNADRSSPHFIGDKSISNTRNQSILLNNSIPYVPNDVYMADRTYNGYDNTLATGNKYTKMDEAVVKAKTDQLYEHFLEVVRVRTNDAEIFDTVQDMIQLCSDTFDDIVRNGVRLNEKNVFDGFGWLNQERNTWKLLHCLYKDRLLNQQAMDGVDDDDDLWLHSSEKEIIEKLYKQNENVREYQLIIDWLEQCESQQYLDRCSHFLDETISWENTLHQLQNFGKTVFGGGKDIVKSLDPDAPNREQKPLHDLDMEDETRISKEILFEIRQGRLHKAGELCERVGQFWRAAVLEGWRLHHDPNYKESESSSEKEPIEGNPRRDLWKKLAWQMAENKKLNEYTRAYLGVFCGHLQSLLGPLSNSWFDLLWAYLKVQIDIRVESELCSVSNKSYLEMPQKYWDNKMTLEEIFDELSAHKNIPVRDVAKHRMTIIRKYIVLDDIPEMMRNVNTWLDDMKQDGQMLRFITHVVLFMRQIERRHPEEIANSVIRTYVEYLIGQTAEASLVAFYTAALPGNQQIELYAKYMENVRETLDRKAALDEALTCGLDINAIAPYAVLLIRLKQEEDGTERQLAGTISALDEEKISALEWLTFNSDQCGDLLWHANALIRTFLGGGKIEGVRRAFNLVPSNVVQTILTNYGTKENLPAKIECSIHEYKCHMSYLAAMDSHNDWLRLYNSKPKEPTLVSANAHFTERMASEHKEQAFLADLERWQMNLMEQTQITRNHFHHVLMFPDKGYLVDPDTANVLPDDEKDTMEIRLDQLNGLRKLYIPQLVLHLHNILHCSGEYKAAVGLADELVSEQCQLYLVYAKHELAEILGKISESSLALINVKMDPWGYTSTS